MRALLAADLLLFLCMDVRVCAAAAAAVVAAAADWSNVHSAVSMVAYSGSASYWRVLANSPQPGNANTNITFDCHSIPKVTFAFAGLRAVCSNSHLAALGSGFKTLRPTWTRHAIWEFPQIENANVHVNVDVESHCAFAICQNSLLTCAETELKTRLVTTTQRPMQ